MRKPIHPQHQGVHEPKKVLSKNGNVYIADLDQYLTHKVPLAAVVGAWNKAVKDHENQGHRITEGPNFVSDSFYGSKLRLVYTYEWDNPVYNEELSCYTTAMSEYVEKLRLWQEYEARMKEIEHTPKGLDEKIVRCERRLANLKAHKAGEPLPFPEG